MNNELSKHFLLLIIVKQHVYLNQAFNLRLVSII